MSPLLILALVFGVPSLLTLFGGALKENGRRQRVRRSREIRRDLARAERVRIDALTIGSARRSPDLPSIKRTVS